MKRTVTVLGTILLLVAVSAGCGRNSETLNGATVAEITESVRSGLGEQYVRMPVAMDEDTLSALLGIDPEHVEEYAGDFSMTMTSADSFIAIHAKDGYGEEVRSALAKRQQAVERMFERYLPGPLRTAKAGKVLQRGDYVFLIILGDSENGPEKDVERAERIINDYFEQE